MHACVRACVRVQILCDSRDHLLSGPSFIFPAGPPLPKRKADAGDPDAAHDERLQEESGGELLVKVVGAAYLPRMEAVGVSRSTCPYCAVTFRGKTQLRWGACGDAQRFTVV